MTEYAGEPIVFDVLIERDINILLLEEMRLSSAFQVWLVNKLSGGRKKISRFLSVTHLAVNGELGTVDILFLFEDDKKQRCAFLIENKMDRPQEKVMAGRYFEYGEKGLYDGAWDEYLTCLVSPADYFATLDENEYFSSYLSYEDLAAWFVYARDNDPSLPPHRAAYKEQLMRFALAQWKNITSGLSQNRKVTFTPKPVAPPSAKKATPPRAQTAIQPPPSETPTAFVYQNSFEDITRAPDPRANALMDVDDFTARHAPMMQQPVQQQMQQPMPPQYMPQQAVPQGLPPEMTAQQPVYDPAMQQQPMQQPVYGAPAAAYAPEEQPMQMPPHAAFDAGYAAPQTSAPAQSVQSAQPVYAPQSPDVLPQEDAAFNDDGFTDADDADAPVQSKDFSDFKLFPGGILNLPKNYKEGDDSVMKVFAAQYKTFAAEKFAHLNMAPLSPTDEEHETVEFVPDELPPDIKILHHVTTGCIDLMFIHTPLSSIQTAYKPLADDDMTLKEVENSALVRIGVPVIDPQRGLESQKDLADFALKKANKLYMMFLQATGLGAPQTQNAPKATETSARTNTATPQNIGQNQSFAAPRPVSNKARKEHPSTTPDDLFL